jgi:hypothetical protein
MREDAFIISQDRYRDLIEKNPNLEGEITKRSVKFSIINDTVLFDKKIDPVKY